MPDNKRTGIGASFFEGAEHDSPARAVFLILLALAALSFQDAIVKFVTDDTSLWQFQILRATMNLAFIACILTATQQLRLFWPKNPRAVAARTSVMVITMIFFFSGAPFLTLAEMGAGLYTYPLFNTALSWLFLRERVGLWRVSAILLSALGAILIIRPGSEGFSLVQILPVAAGFCYAVNSIILRRHCRGESPFTMTAWVGAGFLIAGAVGVAITGLSDIPQKTRDAWPFLLDPWPALAGFVVVMALVASFCNVIGNLLIVKAYQTGELSWLAPFDYSYLIMATIWGFILFSDLPDAIAISGMALIAVGGILIAWRENRIRKPRPTS